MEKISELLIELKTSKDLQEIIVAKRRKKMIIRWIFGAIFYYCLWYYSWARVLFWISVPLELILLVFTLVAYFRLKEKIKRIEEELKMEVEL